jgi:hypothetical protein
VRGKDRWRCSHRCNVVQRAVECCVCQRWPARSADRCAPDVRTFAQPRPQVPSVTTNWRTHARHRPRNQVRVSTFFSLHLRRSLVRYCDRNDQGRHIHLAVNIVPSCPHCPRNISRLWHLSALLNYSRHADVDDVFVDLQVRLGLCGYHSRDHGRIYVVHGPYHGVAVSRCSK